MTVATRKRVYEGKEPSDTTFGTDYQVYLFDNSQGVCNCPDFHNRGVVAGNLDYKCKHLTRALTKYNQSLAPASKSVTQLGPRRIEIFADGSDNLFLEAIDLNNGILQRAARVSEAEVLDAFKRARQEIAREKSVKLNQTFAKWSRY